MCDYVANCWIFGSDVYCSKIFHHLLYIVETTKIHIFVLKMYHIELALLFTKHFRIFHFRFCENMWLLLKKLKSCVRKFGKKPLFFTCLIQPQQITLHHFHLKLVNQSIHSTDPITTDNFKIQCRRGSVVIVFSGLRVYKFSTL